MCEGKLSSAQKDISLTQVAVSTAVSSAVTVRRFISLATNVGTCNDRLLSPRFPTGLPVSCAPRVPSALQ